MDSKDGRCYEETEHLGFSEVGFTGKTYIISVINIHDGVCVGQIKWFGRWRKYCFFPNKDTVFDSKCLSDISGFMDRLMQDHKEQTKKRATANALKEKTYRDGGSDGK